MSIEGLSYSRWDLLCVSRRPRSKYERSALRHSFHRLSFSTASFYVLQEFLCRGRLQDCENDSARRFLSPGLSVCLRTVRLAIIVGVNIEQILLQSVVSARCDSFLDGFDILSFHGHDGLNWYSPDVPLAWSTRLYLSRRRGAYLSSRSIQVIPPAPCLLSFFLFATFSSLLAPPMRVLDRVGDSA